MIGWLFVLLGEGYGDPLERDSEKVLNDVINGLVSLESARNDYRVVIGQKSLKIDVRATDRLRMRMKRRSVAKHPMSEKLDLSRHSGTRSKIAHVERKVGGAR